MPSLLRKLDHPVLLLVITMLLWGGNSVVGRAVREDIPPVTLAFWRWTIAAAVVAPFVWRQFIKDLPALKAGWKETLLLGLTGVALFNTFLYEGLRHTTAINTLTLQSAIPALVLVIGALIFREKIPGRIWGGVLLSMLGVLVIATHGEIGRLTHLGFGIGEVWMLAAVAVYALYTAALRLRPKNAHPMSFLLATFLIGVIFLAPFYLWERGARGGVDLTPTTLAAFLYVGLFPSLIAYIAFNRAVEAIGAPAASPYLHLTPLFGILLAMVFLGERPEAYHFIGGAFIAAGIFWATRKVRTQET
ncbi:DMT family transporter [Neomegalonema perideroedes]|uniref:DMT family transporter n=1 Tax=Neomegalonema perideroedes TaxID=217219 RepID=UPI000595436B|nr:DMT family transporter [Neomegalonema perideroedes]